MTEYLTGSEKVKANCTCYFANNIERAVRLQTHSHVFQLLFRQIGLKTISTCGHKIA